jgi:enoyl-CoA hydratase
MYQNILCTIINHIAEITINRPEKLNALNIATIDELHECLNAISKNDEVRCVIITGAGTKSFVAGADISEFANFSSEEGA